MQQLYNEKVSVIVPIFNDETYIRKCIYTIVNQTYKNLEIVLINDGSYDRSGAIIEEYAKKDNRIRTIHQSNQGLSSARNTGLEKCTGDYIMFVDGDDWIDINIVEELVTIIKSSKKDIIQCGYHMVETNIDDYKDKEIHDIQNNSPVIRKLTSEESLLELLQGSVYFHVWGKLFRRELFNSDITFPIGRNYEDLATTWKIIEISNGVALSRRKLYYHNRFNPDSITRTKTMSNICDRWNSSKEMFIGISHKNPELYQLSVKQCLISVSHAWRWACSNNWTDINNHYNCLKEMNSFAKEHKNEVNNNDYRLTEIVGIIFGCHLNRLSLKMCYYLNLFARTLYEFFAINNVNTEMI